MYNKNTYMVFVCRVKRNFANFWILFSILLYICKRQFHTFQNGRLWSITDTFPKRKYGMRIVIKPLRKKSSKIFRFDFNGNSGGNSIMPVWAILSYEKKSCKKEIHENQTLPWSPSKDIFLKPHNQSKDLFSNSKY